MRNLLQDLQYTVRQMMKSPAFTILATLTLALGIGANTTIFSVVNGVLLNPLPYPQPDRLVTLFHQKQNFVTGSISYLNFLDWQRDNKSFEAMAAYRNSGDLTLTGSGQPENVKGEMISAGFFEILGIKPLLGRTFAADEDRLGANPATMISEGLWKRKFASNPHIVGQAIILNGVPRTIVGVVPASFQLQQWNFRPAEAYTPVGEYAEPQFRARSAAWGMDAIARLKPGVTLAEASQDMARVNRALEAAYPDVDAGIKTHIVPMRDEIVGDVRPVLLVLMGAVLFVLLIACVNVANLQLARSTAREREFAVRVALGAQQSRLIRQVLTESIVLAMAGGALGLLLAYWGAKAAVAAIPDTLPRAENIAIDGRVLLFTLFLSVVAGVVFGLAPAFKTSRTDVNATLNLSGRSLVGSHHRSQAIFVTIEMALALVLLVGAGLMIRTLARLWTMDPGFNPHNVLVFTVIPSHSLRSQTPAAIRTAYRQMESTIRSVPGVEAVSPDWGAVPMDGDWEEYFWVEGRSQRPEHEADLPMALRYGVEPDYLKLMQIPLLRGRFFTDADNEHSSRVVVIDEGLAKRYFPGQDPIGKHLHFFQEVSGGPRTDEIIGVVGHVNQFGLGQDQRSLQAQVYEPFQQTPNVIMRRVAEDDPIFVRLREGVEPESSFPAMRRSLMQLDNQMVVADMHPMQQLVAKSIARQRFAVMLFSAFAAGALLLASLGIYGVLSYVVGQRTREVGIRIALGAQQGDVMRGVLRDGARMTLPGIGIGIVAALAVTRLMSAVLFEVAPTDFLTFASVPVLLCVVALLACYLPARRAAKLDPIRALRAE